MRYLLETLPSTQIHAFPLVSDLRDHLREHPQCRLLGRIYLPFRTDKRSLYVLAEYASKTEAQNALRESMERIQSYVVQHPPAKRAAKRCAAQNELALAIQDALSGTVNAQRFPGILCLSDLLPYLEEQHIKATPQTIAAGLRQLGWGKFDRVLVRDKKEQVWTFGEVANVAQTLRSTPPSELI